MADAKTLFIFPGQGSQYSGIGSDLFDASAAARDIYSRASNTLGFDIAELCFGVDEKFISHALRSLYC